MNAKTEILEHIESREVEFVRLKIIHKGKTIEGKLDEVLPLLDFEYHDGYGTQYLDGVIWYADGTWSDRREYDGSEWWEWQVRPFMPKIANK